MTTLHQYVDLCFEANLFKIGPTSNFCCFFLHSSCFSKCFSFSVFYVQFLCNRHCMLWELLSSSYLGCGTVSEEPVLALFFPFFFLQGIQTQLKVCPYKKVLGMNKMTSSYWIVVTAALGQPDGYARLPYRTFDSYGFVLSRKVNGMGNWLVLLVFLERRGEGGSEWARRELKRGWISSPEPAPL